MQAAECSQLRSLLSSDDPNHQRGVATSITVTMSAVQSHTPNVTPTRCRTVAVHRRWGRSLWATTTVAVECRTDLFVASHWLERSSSRSSVNFARIQSSRSQIKSTNLLLCVFFYLHFFIEGLLQKPPSSSDLPLIGPRPWSHTPRLIVMHIIFRSLLKIFEYAAKRACKQLQCNKAKLSEPAWINGLHIHRDLG